MLTRVDEVGLAWRTSRANEKGEEFNGEDGERPRWPKWHLRLEGYTDEDHMTGLGGKKPGDALRDEDEAARDPANPAFYSVNVKTANLDLFCCCFYNCFCCCFECCVPRCIRRETHNWWCGPWCGKAYCLGGWLRCCSIKLRRDRWLWGLHAVCFGIHLTWMIFTMLASSGDMKVELTRIKPNWENRGGEYSFKVVPLDDDEQIFRIDTITALFFGLSAGMHAIWVFIGPWEWSKPFLWNKLDECLCWWCAAHVISLDFTLAPFAPLRLNAAPRVRRRWLEYRQASGRQPPLRAPRHAALPSHTRCRAASPRRS